eukprot:5841645-Prymnesium_polylepis.1
MDPSRVAATLSALAALIASGSSSVRCVASKTHLPAPIEPQRLSGGAGKRRMQPKGSRAVVWVRSRAAVRVEKDGVLLDARLARERRLPVGRGRRLRCRLEALVAHQVLEVAGALLREEPVAPRDRVPQQVELRVVGVDALLHLVARGAHLRERALALAQRLLEWRQPLRLLSQRLGRSERTLHALAQPPREGADIISGELEGELRERELAARWQRLRQRPAELLDHAVRLQARGAQRGPHAIDESVRRLLLLIIFGLGPAALLGSGCIDDHAHSGGRGSSWRHDGVAKLLHRGRTQAHSG